VGVFIACLTPSRELLEGWSFRHGRRSGVLAWFTALLIGAGINLFAFSYRNHENL
jgi:hypothetical protein